MGAKNIFTGEPKGEEQKHPHEAIASLLARAEATNPVAHQSGPRGLSGLGAGSRQGSLTHGHRRRERASSGKLFGIKSDKEEAASKR